MKYALLSIVILLSAFVTQAYAITALYYFSEPGDFIGQGETVWVTPADGFDFSVSRNFDNGVAFSIDNFNDPTVPFQDRRWWYLDLAAPFDAELTVGAYEDATRFPFQEESAPGLDFSGNGRGNNTLTGRFDITEVSYGPGGDVLQFAANFEQHGEGDDPALFGQIRYNSTVAVTLPAISGTVKTANDIDICAMVLASGQFTFSCNPVGVFSLTDLPLENDGTVKRQIYADGFFPKIDILTEPGIDAVVMTRSGACPSYNTPYDAGVFPGSAGKQINISGKVLLQNSQTPICAMVLANGQYMFSCDGSGSYALNIPLDTNGQLKLQVYADGFAPTIQTFDEFQAINDVRMARAVECQ